MTGVRQAAPCLKTVMLKLKGLKKVDLNAFNEEKNTPLHWACLNGHLEVVKKLILAGADVSVLNSYERTPMDEAVTRGKMDVIDAINTAVAQVELTGIRVS
ncbi:Ankyrin repeat-containing protein P16F5.05c [Morella rubra]|uniref:Ankyrin repeat-containing protein P16F5.05c n=1 Tax=Morella rubra TaxID=262757 RepID=A0A6A1WRQ9_9ROSI|nr:Ankyrin repeat-containing protein P16F5.05c [Morella rubra]